MGIGCRKHSLIRCSVVLTNEQQPSSGSTRSTRCGCVGSQFQPCCCCWSISAASSCSTESSGASFASKPAHAAFVRLENLAQNQQQATQCVPHNSCFPWPMVWPSAPRSGRHALPTLLLPARQF